MSPINTTSNYLLMAILGVLLGHSAINPITYAFGLVLFVYGVVMGLKRVIRADIEALADQWRSRWP